MVFAMLYVEKIESASDFFANKEWTVTARPGAQSGESLTWRGKGECPWHINQKLQVTIAPFLEED
jgi:hypothetical protein